jgi:hypothetical protein
MVCHGGDWLADAQPPQGPRIAASVRPLRSRGAGGAGGVDEPRPYRPENVGNDASARPWERSNAMRPLEPLGGNQNRRRIHDRFGVAGSQTWGIPAGFDVEGFLKAAKTNFVTLQAAWDKSDIASCAP